MPTNDVCISRLPPDVAKEIQASVSITNLNDVVVELVKNSLDSGARSISVSLDYVLGGCVVQDDGHGISSETFQEGCGFGLPHHTSKFNLIGKTYGYRGCFLASLGALSLLRIISRNVVDGHLNSIVFHWSKVISRLNPSPTHDGLGNCRHGTRVVVNDLFGNMPVRVKTRALVQQRSADMEKQWEGLKRMLTAVVLVAQHPFKLKVSEEIRNRQLNFRANPRLESWANLSNEALDIHHIRSTLAQGGQISRNIDKSWSAVCVRTSDVVMRAAISLTPSPAKHCQFVSVGLHPVSPQKDIHGLYDEMNRLFDASNFGRIDADNEADSTSQPSSLAPSRKRKHLTAKVSNKGISRWPKFFLHIQPTNGSLSINHGTLGFGLDSTMLLNILDIMVIQFLEEQHLNPRAQSQQKIVDPLSKTSSNKLDRLKRTPGSQLFSGDHAKEGFESSVKIAPSRVRGELGNFQTFNHWTRTKARSGPLKEIDSGTMIDTAQDGQMSGCSHPNLQIPVSGDREFCDPTQSIAAYSERHFAWSQDETERIPWTDSSTKTRALINSQACQNFSSLSHDSGEILQRPRSASSVLEQRQDSFLRSRSAVTDPESSGLGTILDRWDNPVFIRSEKAIPYLRNAAFGNSTTLDRPQHYSCYTFKDVNTVGFDSRFCKSDLLKAEARGQVDKKYILLRIGDSLALVDQHAADERCRVEELFAQMFVKDSAGSAVVQSTQLLEPILIPIASNEISLFKASQKRFELWGCCYSISQSKEKREMTAVVTALPTVIFERCRTDTNLLKDILREDVWKRTESAHSFPSASDTNLFPEWVQQMASCPKGIIELLNSRACRSAIMFNDPLSVTDCNSLVRRLSSCVFPFQCAHGRPSVIPLVMINWSFFNTQSNNISNGVSQSLSFAEMFKAWDTD